MANEDNQQQQTNQQQSNTPETTSTNPGDNLPNPNLEYLKDSLPDDVFEKRRK